MLQCNAELSDEIGVGEAMRADFLVPGRCPQADIYSVGTKTPRFRFSCLHGHWLKAEGL